MIESDHRPSYIEVQLDAIATNLEQVIEPLPRKDTGICSY